jgi:hypothetical protein
MNNVTFIEVEGVKHAIIDRGNGEYTSMLKSYYDAQLAAQSTPIDTEDE